MNIGYACLTVDVPNTRLKHCKLLTATEENLKKIIDWNLKIFDRILDYNILNNIRIFRISSDIIPFASHPTNRLRWTQIFAEPLIKIGKKTLQHGLRLSMHPGQYTVLNSPHLDVVHHAIEDLRYHNRFLDALGIGSSHKIVLHIGGVYGDKIAAIKRFIQHYHQLDTGIIQRLVIENDDRSYSVEDTLMVSEHTGIPVIFDNLHNDINKSLPQKTELEWILECRKTWRQGDGVQKIHYSQQAQNKRKGSHAETIYIPDFISFCRRLPEETDIMLEVKDKNISAIKCIAALKAFKNSLYS